MDLTVRKATADDYDAVCELFDQVDAMHRGNLPHMFRQPVGPAIKKDYFAGLVADENVALLVAEAGEHLVGYVHAEVKEAPDMPILVPRRYVVVDSIAVKVGFQNRGIGGALMARVQEWATAKEASTIELNVYEFNEKAVSFYESLGYRNLSRKMSKELKTEERE
jgi:ribosomal protein S18 acetylase RimI-like enzyme